MNQSKFRLHHAALVAIAATSIGANGTARAADPTVAPPQANSGAGAAPGNAPNETCGKTNFFSNLTAIGSPSGAEAIKVTSFSSYFSDPKAQDKEDFAPSGNLRFSNAVATGSGATKLQLLSQETALYNLYASFIRLPTLTTTNCSDPVANARHFSLDRYYLNNPTEANAQPTDKSGTFNSFGIFIVSGLGLRGLANSSAPSGPTNTTGGSSGSTSATSAGTNVAGTFGTVYAGLGFDGKPFDEDGVVGYASFQGYYSWNKMNRGITSSAFPNTDYTQFSTMGLKFDWYMPKKIALRIDYSKGLGGFGKERLGDLVSFSASWSTSATTL